MAPESGRKRGEVEKLPSGNIRVKIYAGIDPVTRKKHFLTEIVPAGPGAKRAVERARTRLLAQVDERRNPRTSATVAQLMERHLSMLDVVRRRCPAIRVTYGCTSTR